MTRFTNRWIFALSFLVATGWGALAFAQAPVTVGEPWVGEMGITETVEQIMARQALQDAHVRWDEPEEADKPKHEADDNPRDNLPQDSNAQETPQFPPYNGGDVEPDNPQTVGPINFVGATLADSGFIPPDTMAAVGPTQIVVHLNGRIRSFNKATGVADGALNTTTNTFFNSVRNGSGTSDPQVRFDRLSNRWFATIVNVSTPNRVLIAVSSGPTIVNTASFTFYFFQHDQDGGGAADNGGFLDYPSLGIDANALYIGGNIFNPGFASTTGHVVRKSSVLSGGPIVATAFRQLGTGGVDGPYSPRGVDNDDPSATEGYFVGVGTITFGTIYVRRVSTPGGTPTISGNLSVSGMSTTTSPINVPQPGGATALDSLDDRLYAATIHKNKLTGLSTLWTAHSFQVNASGVASGSGGRDGSRWYEIQNMTGSPSVRQLGTLFDSAAVTPSSYWIPSVAMSGQGHMALGSSRCGAAAGNFASAATAGRFGTDALGTIQAPSTIFAGTATYVQLASGRNRWGDYSMTHVDPNDDMTIWTVQEYCNAANSWAVRVTQLRAPLPATPSSASPPTIQAGTANANVVVTGTSSVGSGFFDPDVAFPNHISATVNGGGVTVNSVTFTNPTSITMNISVSGGAALGLRTITVTNPDGQLATSAGGILEITSACPAISISPPTLPDGTVDSPYSQTVTASGGGAPYTFIVLSGSLPANLSMDTSGNITGTPVQGTNGVFNFTVQATDKNGCTGTQAYSLTINCPAITIDPASLPDGDAGVAYSQTLTASGGTAPYTFTIFSGTLPTGLSLSPTGDITGTPSAGTYNFTVQVTDTYGCTATQAYTITINCPVITIDPATLPDGQAGVAYSQTVTASGGDPPYAFTLQSGSLPPGLSLSGTGDITGMPATAGTFNFTVQATDAFGCIGLQAYTITTTGCALLGDVNVDTFVDGGDVQDFTDCVLTGTSTGNCNCADMDGSTVVDELDIDPFVDLLLL